MLASYFAAHNHFRFPFSQDIKIPIRSVEQMGILFIKRIVILSLYAVEVRAVARIHFDDFAFVDEERYTNFNTRFQLSGLCSVGSRVTLEARFRVNNLQLSLHGHFSEENRFRRSVAYYFADVTFLHVVNTGDQVLTDRHLVERFLVHEDVVRAFHVEVLVGATFYTYVFESFANVETLFEYATIYNIFQRGTHDGVTLAGLYMEEVNAEVELAIQTDAGALLDVL